MRCALLLVALLPATARALAAAVPVLEVETAAPFAGLAGRLEAFDRQRLQAMLGLLGLEDGGPPIRVLLAEESSAAARLAPSWSVGYAIGEAGQIVLMPGRIPAYPDRNLEAVLHHEIAHVLIARAAGRRPVPRWFNEGVAIWASRDWGLEDRTHLMLAALSRRGHSLADLDELFQAGASSAGRAYALAAAFVRYLIDHYGETVVADVLHRMAQGASFERAFAAATGTTLADFEAVFWRDLTFWNRWVPFLTSSATLWMAITALALVAFKRRRDRDQALRDRWLEEERRWIEEPTSDSWVN